MSSVPRAGIALGGNLLDRVHHLSLARQDIFELERARAPFFSSALYESEPVECEPGARPFLNSVIELGYKGSPRQLLAELQQIEVLLGRPADHSRNRSRTIDLDLLYFGTHQIDEPGLQLPHPRLHLRGFVLRPLAEIRPDLVLPGQTRTAADLSHELVAASSVVRTLHQW